MIMLVLHHICPNTSTCKRFVVFLIIVNLCVHNRGGSETTSFENTVNNIFDTNDFFLQMFFSDLIFLILGAGWFIRACSVSTIEEIASVFYLISLDSADVLAIKVYFKNRTVSETNYEKGPGKKARQRHRERPTLFFNNRYMHYARISSGTILECFVQMLL